MTTFTNSKLTDEYVSNATLIRLILWADQHNSHYVVAALRELQERRKADSVPIEINDDMAYAFHHALSDSSLGSDEIEEIKTGLRAAFANVSFPVTADGWISCSERMPVIGELNWRTSFPLLVTCGIGVIPAYYGFVRVNGNKHYGFMESLKYGDDSGNHPQTNEYDLISNVTHWMPLPEPPQEVS